VDRLVPREGALGAVQPVHPPVRFYAPRPLAFVRPRTLAGVSHALLWEEDLPRWRRAGVRLRVVAKSHSRPASQGRLVLVAFETS
jgi:hypothetical protein